MTNSELDLLLKKILEDAIDAENEDSNSNLCFSPSLHYQKQIRSMLNNPLAWVRRESTSIWKISLRYAAIFLLVISVAFGGVMVTMPSVRAAVIQWVVEWYETHITYRYFGTEDTNLTDLRFEISSLPAEYHEVQRTILDKTVSVIYEDKDERSLYFEYTLMHQGTASAFYIDESKVSEITVNSMPGQYYEALIDGDFNTLTWLDTQESVQFILESPEDFSFLMDLAQSVKKIE